MRLLADQPRLPFATSRMQRHDGPSRLRLRCPRSPQNIYYSTTECPWGDRGWVRLWRAGGFWGAISPQPCPGRGFPFPRLVPLAGRRRRAMIAECSRIPRRKRARERGNQLAERNRPGAQVRTVRTRVLSCPSPTANLAGRSRRGAAAGMKGPPRLAARRCAQPPLAALPSRRSIYARSSTARRSLARSRPAPPPPGPSHRRQQRDVDVHLLLAHGGRRALRPGQHRLLHRRHRRGGHRTGRPLVHPRRHAFQLRRPQRLHRKLLALRPRRRLSRGQGGYGRIPRQVVGLRLDVRLHPHRPDQRHVGRAVYHGPAAGHPLHDRPRAEAVPGRARTLLAQLGRGHHRLRHHALLLPPEPGRHPRVQRQGAEDHGGHHRHGRRDPRLVRRHPAWSAGR